MFPAVKGGPQSGIQFSHKSLNKLVGKFFCSSYNVISLTLLCKHRHKVLIFNCFNPQPNSGASEGSYTCRNTYVYMKNFLANCNAMIGSKEGLKASIGMQFTI